MTPKATSRRSMWWLAMENRDLVRDRLSSFLALAVAVALSCCFLGWPVLSTRGRVACVFVVVVELFLSDTVLPCFRCSVGVSMFTRQKNIGLIQQALRKMIYASTLIRVLCAP